MVPILLENNYYLPLIYGFRVANCIAAGIWNDSKYILTQVEGLGLRYAQMLHEKDIKTFGRLMECTPGQIELATGRNQPFGIKILKSVESIPLCNMNITHLKSAPNQHEYKVELRLKKPSALVKKTHAFHLLIGSSSGSMIKSTKICAFKLTSPVTYSIKFKPTIANETIQFNLISYDFVGIDVKYEIHLCNSIKNMPKSSSGGSKYFEDSLWDGIDDQTLLKMCEQQEAIQMSEGPYAMKPKPTDCNPGPITTVGKRRLAKIQLKWPGKLKSVPEIAKITSQFPVLDQENNCLHICKDKSKCLHLCCKIGVKGIKRSRSKSKKPSEDNSTDETELAKKTTKNDIIRKNVEEHLMKEECDEIGYDDDDTLFIQYKETSKS